jgi:hypothetical protein
MLNISKGLADWTERQIQEIHGTSPHESNGSSDQSTQIGYLSLRTSVLEDEFRKLQTGDNLHYVGN